MQEVPLMQLLKEDTRGQHNDAEAHPFQGSLAQGQLPYESYCRYVTYLYDLHKGFESQLAEKSKSDPLLAAIMKDEYYQMPFLKNDLQSLNLPLPAKAPECIEKFLRLPQFAEHPVSLLGVLYVLLGSKHGAKFIAHSVKEAYKLNAGGYSYFDPYGGEFRPLWQTFVANMNDMSLTPPQREAVLAAARATFDIFGSMGEEIWDLQTAAVRS